MDRIQKITDYLQKHIHEGTDRNYRNLILIHIMGVAQFASMIALRRNLDPEVLTAAALLHDIHTLDTLDSHKHAHIGADKAREILNSLGGFTQDEMDTICTAIYNHSDKKTVHADYDEALKDADVLQHCLYNVNIPPSQKDANRFENLLKEFNLAKP